MVYGEDLILDDFADLGKSAGEFIEEIEVLGLSDTEAKVYLVLLLAGHITADGIASISGIPRTSTYRALETLKNKGFAEAVGRRPVIYTPSGTQKIRRRITERLDYALELIDEIMKVNNQMDEGNRTLRIGRRELVMKKIADEIGRARESIIISTPRMNAVSREFSRHLKEAIKKGVIVWVITANGQRLPPHTEVSRVDGLNGLNMVFDSEVLITGKEDMSACTYTIDNYIAENISSMLRNMTGVK